MLKHFFLTKKREGNSEINGHFLLSLPLSQSTWEIICCILWRVADKDLLRVKAYGLHPCYQAYGISLGIMLVPQE